MLKRRLRNISRSRYLFHTVTVTIRFVWKRIFQTITLYEKFFSKTSIKLFIMRTILWIINISVIVHLCVEISFCWWNWLCLFFQFEASNWLMHKAHKIFFESSMWHPWWIIILKKTTTTENFFCRNRPIFMWSFIRNNSYLHSFLVMYLVAKPFIWSEAEGDLVVIETSI